MSTSASNTETKPNSTGSDAMATALRQAAQQMDAGIEVQEEALHPASAGSKQEGQPAGDTAAGKPAPEGEKTKPGTAAPSKDGAGAEKKSDKSGGEAKPPAEKSEFQKKKEEAERYDRNWRKFQEEREAFRRERAEFDRQRDEPAASRGQANQPLKDGDGYTADQWETAAKQWEKEGKFELADGARERAKGLREREGRAERNQPAADARREAPAENRPPEQTPGTPEFTQTWRNHLTELEGSEEYGDLKKKDSELYKSVAELLHTEPRLSQFNDGIRIAAEIAKLRLEAAAVPGLRKTLEEQNTELEKLRKATSPAAGGPESRGKPKTFEEMSAVEQAAHLKNAAAEHDSG